MCFAAVACSAITGDSRIGSRGFNLQHGFPTALPQWIWKHMLTCQGVSSEGR
jgi:hypothetical protein